MTRADPDPEENIVEEEIDDQSNALEPESVAASSESDMSVLLLRSQIYLWGSLFLLRCLRMLLFFHPTIEVITFSLCGWCVLSVFLLLAFIDVGHEYRDLLSLCDGMHVCTD